MNNIIEGNSKKNDDLVGRLHGIIRPFVLRRLKKDVETQMPGKYEHIVKCHLSRRQVSSIKFVIGRIYFPLPSLNFFILRVKDVFVRRIHGPILN